MKNVTIISFYINLFILINRIYLYFIFSIKTTNRKFHRRKDSIEQTHSKKSKKNMNILINFGREFSCDREFGVISQRINRLHLLQHLTLRIDPISSFHLLAQVVHLLVPSFHLLEQNLLALLTT